MKMKYALVLFAAVVGTMFVATVGSVLPEDYWTTAYQTKDPGISPGQETVPVANGDLDGTPLSKIPISAWPGHPGGFYLEVVSTGYGVLYEDISGENCNAHISPDKTSAQVSTWGGTRDFYKINFTLDRLGDENVPIMINTIADRGVEVSFDVVGNVTKTYWVAMIVLENWTQSNQTTAPISVYTHIFGNTTWNGGVVLANATNITSLYNATYLYFSNNGTTKNTTINTYEYGQHYSRNPKEEKYESVVEIWEIYTTDLFGFTINLSQITYYHSWCDNWTYNASAFIKITAYINKSAIGNGGEAINFTLDGLLYTSNYPQYDAHPNPNNAKVIQKRINHTTNVIFDGCEHDVIVRYSDVVVNYDVGHAGGHWDSTGNATAGVFVSPSSEVHLILKKMSEYELKKLPIQHVTPGTWVFTTGDDGKAVVIMYVYPQPIASGDKKVAVTFSRL
jgi:hypothetical protein